MRATTRESITIAGRRIEYSRVHSKRARSIRVRVSVNGVEVLQPEARAAKEVTEFLRNHREWLFGQLDRVACFKDIRRPAPSATAEILFRGRPTPVRVEHDAAWHGANRVIASGDVILIVCGTRRTPPARTFENWLRAQARREIAAHLAKLIRRVKREPSRVYVMGQRTKWGNCSTRNNLSFNWRLVLAPDFVLRYLVAHEAVHLAIPDHSARFWLTLRSLCPETESARQWLVRHAAELQRDLVEVCRG